MCPQPLPLHPPAHTSWPKSISPVANPSLLVPGPILCCTRPVPPFPKLIDIATWWCMSPPANVAATRVLLSLSCQGHRCHCASKPVVSLTPRCQCHHHHCVTKLAMLSPPTSLCHQASSDPATKLVMLAPPVSHQTVGTADTKSAVPSSPCHQAGGDTITMRPSCRCHHCHSTKAMVSLTPNCLCHQASSATSTEQWCCPLPQCPQWSHPPSCHLVPGAAVLPGGAGEPDPGADEEGEQLVPRVGAAADRRLHGHHIPCRPAHLPYGYVWLERGKSGDTHEGFN